MEVEIYKMKYNISKNTNYLRILGKNFVTNNDNKGKIIINNKKERIKSILSIINFKQNKIKIKMVLSKNICNISCIFKDCELLESLCYKNKKDIIDDKDDLQYINEENTNFSYTININNNNDISITESIYNNISDYCSNSEITNIEEKKSDISIRPLPCFAKKNSYYFINMSYMFFNCNSLTFIPDISEWKLNNLDNMANISYMFSNCKSLLSLPDLSKWKTDNVIDMSYMFYNCNSLSSFPDISKWKTDNVYNFCSMFSDCKSISSLPNISKWRTDNVNNVSYMFNTG